MVYITKNDKGNYHLKKNTERSKATIMSGAATHSPRCLLIEGENEPTFLFRGAKQLRLVK